jgi:hypothetical protein
MKPIIICTTPRTGANLVCQQLGAFGYKNTLYEFFGVQLAYESEFRRINDRIEITKYEPRDTPWYTSKREVQLERLKLLDNDYNYMIKFFPFELEPEAIELIKENYSIVYLERRNRLDQFLSWLAMTTTKKSHYRVTDNEAVEEIVYSKSYANYFIDWLKAYDSFKQDNPSAHPILYYEDYIEQGSNEQALVKLLNLPIQVTTLAKSFTKPTPYKLTPEQLIVNQSDWLADRDELIKNLG